MQAADKKRPREEREILHRLRPFARLQTAEDYEAFATDMLCALSFAGCDVASNQRSLDEAILRKRIQELQHYRRLGLCTAADIDKYEHDLSKRVRKMTGSVAHP
jgi:transcriptional adapter 2-alpha